MNEEISKEIKKAVRELKQNDGGLIESDSLLRDEIINHKIDYLTDIVGSVGRLIIEMNLKIPSKDAVVNYSNSVTKANARTNKLIAQSIEEYKERK